MNDRTEWLNGIEPVIIENTERNYRHRTIANAEWSDITLAFAADFSSPGELTTKRAAGDKFIGRLLTQNDLSHLNDALYWEKEGEGLAGLIRSNPNFREDGIYLNIAGNSMVALSRNGFSSEAVNDIILNVIRQMLNSGIRIKEIRSGGQTGADEAGIIAGQRLGLKCSILAPKGYRIHYREGEEIEGYLPFSRRFQSK